MNRKPISVFKNVINRNCSDLVPPPGQEIDPADETWCDWAPFGKNFNFCKVCIILDPIIHSHHLRLRS